MKKIVVQLLGMAMSLSLIACGAEVSDINEDSSQQIEESSGNRTESSQADDSQTNGSQSGSDQTESSDEYERNSKGVVVLTKEQLWSFMETVTITTDNWQEYFGDMERPYHKEETNDFGETTVIDRTEYYFGLKSTENLFAWKGVAFRFNGYTRYFYSDIFSPVAGQIDAYKEVVYLGDNKKTSCYYDMDGNVVWDVGIQETSTDYVEGHMDLPDYIIFEHDNDNHLENYECIAAVGTLYFLNIPDELWTISPSDSSKEIICFYDEYGTGTMIITRGVVDSFFGDCCDWLFEE